MLACAAVDMSTNAFCLCTKMPRAALRLLARTGVAEPACAASAAVLLKSMALTKRVPVNVMRR